MTKKMRYFCLFLALLCWGQASAQGKDLRIGVMLPLHDVDGDGRRMVEYYRGILMACKELKADGYNIDVHAWNVPIDADIKETLNTWGAPRCNIIFGPLYTSQVPDLSAFAKKNDIKVVIPFSINGNDVKNNKQIYQVYQTPEELNEAAIRHFMERYAGYHPVFIDCNDKTSKKGIFTFGLRKQLEAKGIEYNITNLNSSEEMFAKAFTLSKPNVVILNTGRSPELNSSLARLDALKAANKNLEVVLFGYTDWLMYENRFLEYFYKYDVCVPTYFYYNTLSGKTQDLETAYRRSFGTSMQEALPRFALTGYDHAMFFLRGMARQGKEFKGDVPDKSAVQTQLRFERVGKSGGWKNRQFLFVHYNRNKTISTIVF